MPKQNNPYPNEHAARIRSPEDFQEGSFGRKEIKSGIVIIIGRLKGEITTTTQAYRFAKDKFTPAEAKKWLKDSNIEYISFEAATEKTEHSKNRKRTIEIFAVGTWNGDKYVLRDLEDMVEAFKILSALDLPPAVGGRPYLKLGHNNKQEKDGVAIKDGQPVIGKVIGLGIKDNKTLCAEIEIISDIVFRALKKGLYTSVSSEIYFNYKFNGKLYRRVLGAVALCGADMPAVETLEDLQKHFQSADNISGLFEKKVIYALPLAPKHNNEKGDDVMPETTDRLEGALNKRIEQQEVEVKKLTSDLEAAKKSAGAIPVLQAEAKKYQDKIAKLQEDKQAAAEERAHADFKTLCETYVKSGAMTPAGRDILIGKNARHAYSQDRGLQITLKTFSGFMEATAKILDTREYIAGAGGKQEYPSVSEELDARAKTYAGKNNIDYTTAVSTVIEADPGLAKRYAEEGK